MFMLCLGSLRFVVVIVVLMQVNHEVASFVILTRLASAGTVHLAAE